MDRKIPLAGLNRWMGLSFLLSPLALASPLEFRSEKLELGVASGARLEALVRIPKKKSPRKLPVVLLFGGFENAGDVLDLIRPPAPVLMASFDYPFRPPRKFVFPKSLKFAPEAKHAIRLTHEGILALRSELAKRPDTDPTRVTIIGASFGSPFAVEAAARDPGFQGLALIHGFGNIRKTIEAQALRRWEPRFGFLARPFAWLLTTLGNAYLQPPDVERLAHGLFSHQRVLLVQAQKDQFIPPEASESLKRALESSPAHLTRIEMPGEHLMPGAQRQIQELLAITLEWMRKEALL